MKGQEVIDFLGFDRAISKTEAGNSTVTKSITFEQVEGLGIDEIYFNTDEYGNSYPAVFLKKVDSFAGETLLEIAEVHRKAWNYKKVLFLYVYSETDIRIYNCSEKPPIKTQKDFNIVNQLQNVEIKKYKFSDKNHLEELNMLFSRVAIDSGIIWTLEEAQFVRDKIKLQRRVDKYLVTSLVNTANQLEEQGLKTEFIHKIILRSLFLLYLEDRKATDKKLYSLYKKDATSYFDILDDLEATYKLYRKLETDFNGNIFTVESNEKISLEQLQIVKKCFIRGNDGSQQGTLFKDWRLFDFSIIQIELLSEIYENFLFKTDSELKKRTGTYYTPPSLVEFILNEKLPINTGENNYNIRVLDPSCGSGIFLVESFKRLVKRYENKHATKLTDFNKLKQILIENIYGFELHPQAIKVAAFSLYLALVDCLDPKTMWQKETHQLPNLINNPNDKSIKLQGNNLFCRDAIEYNNKIDSNNFDLIVGNPPFGTKNLLPSIKEYCENYNFAKEMVLSFLHKATELAPNGEIALIFNTKVLTNTSRTYQNFRYWLFNECYVEKVYNFSILRNAHKDYGGQLFGNATGPISIVYYQNEAPHFPSKNIPYYAPKTFIKSNTIDGLIIDFSDLKYLPREACQKPDTKIWKIAMWGGMRDWQLISYLVDNHPTLKNYLEVNNSFYGSGLHPKENEANKMLASGKHIRTERLERYYTPIEKSDTINKEYRKNNPQLFKGPIALIKEGITQRKILATYCEYAVFYNKSVYGVTSIKAEKLKALVIVLNSKLASYYNFLTSSSWGIERDRIVLSEYLQFPYVELDLEPLQDISFARTNFESNLMNQTLNHFNYEKWEKEINKIYNLSTNDLIHIADTVLWSLDLFYEQDKSKALHSISNDMAKEYGTIICKELNDFLIGQDIFINLTLYNINRYTPLMIVKLSHEETRKEVVISEEQIDIELKKLDQHLWEKKSTNIYYRKKLNYKIDNNIFIIRPNQMRFWTKSMALEDANELILELLNGVHDEA